jgi:hypothetical protein
VEDAMGTLSDLARKARNLVSSHPHRADQAVARAEKLVDDRTDGRFDGQTDKTGDALLDSYTEGRATEKP